MRRLYYLDMSTEGLLIKHKRSFDDLVQSLFDIGKEFERDEKIVLYANSLLQKTFSTWIQSQMAFVDTMTFTEFKGCVREEARCLNVCRFNEDLTSMDPDTVRANLAHSNRPRIFPSRKPGISKCNHCGYRGHRENECHKRIAEEYIARQARKAQTPKRPSGKGKGQNGKNGAANLANTNANIDDGSGTASSYNGIFGGLAFCLKAAHNVKVQQTKGVWIKDNGAMHHMHYDKELFTGYHCFKHKLYVGGIGSSLKSVGVGDVTITDPNGHSRTLKRVLHVSKLKSGLMSLNTLALAGLDSTITKDGCTVMDGEFRIHSPIRNGLCAWSENCEVGAARALLTKMMPMKPMLTDWHERLGHVSKHILLKSSDAIADLDLDFNDETNEDHQTPCESCILGKHARAPFPARSNRREKPLELVHSDLAEASVLSLGGGKYVLTFTDDATCQGNVFILANKMASTVLNAFKDYQAWAERQTRHRIKEIRMDRGKEYMGNMIEYLKSQSIEYNPNAGYSPQSNGVAERMNRMLFEMACTMLHSSGAPSELWGEAVLAAAHIRNRLPTSTLDGKTPYEAWTGRKPTVAHIRKWRCKIYRHINKKVGRKKLDKKSMIGFLVGYEAGNIYRIYHPKTRAFKVSRDVKFSENVFIGTKRPDHDNAKHQDNASALSDALQIFDTPGPAPSAHSIEEQADEAPAPIIYPEIIVQPPPRPSNIPPLSSTKPTEKPPNRRLRRQIAHAFKATLKGNWNWPRNYREAMDTVDAPQWKLAMKTELQSINKNNTWDLVPRPKDAKVVKSRWVMRTKDNGTYKARFCARGFTQ